MKIRSKTRFSDTLVISTGHREMTLTVDADLQTLAQAMRKAKEVLAQSQIAAMQEPTQENMAAMGQAIRQLVVCVFGEKQAGQMLDFYEGKPESMLEDIMPYILRKIAPMAARVSAKRRRELERTARRNARRRK